MNRTYFDFSSFRALGMTGLVILAIASFPRAVTGASIVLILHPASDAWAFQEAEKIVINGKTKLRAGAPAGESLTSETYKRLSVTPIGSAPLRRHRGGYLVARSSGSWTPVLPDGLNLKTVHGLAEAWTEAQIQVQEQKGAKAVSVAVASVFAILPGGSANEAVVDFLKDPANFSGVGESGPGEAFDERMGLLIATTRTPAGADSPPLKALLLAAMKEAIDRSGQGIVKYSDIEQGLKFAAVSDKAFPADPIQKQARDTLRKRKTGIDRQVAILSALNAGAQYDAFIEKYGSFEQYDNSFPDLRAWHEQCFVNSAKQHLEDGERFYADKQYSLALQEMKLALSRRPNDKVLEDRIEAVRIDEAEQHAQLTKRKPVDAKSPQQRQVTRYLEFARNYIKSKQWSDAEDQIAAAERIDKNSADVILAKAELFQGKSQPLKAIAMLDEYDRRVSEGDEVTTSAKMRVDIQFEMTQAVKQTLSTITAAMSAGDFASALKAANTGVMLNDNDSAFLYHAGINAAILRRYDEAAGLLNRYLKAAATLVEESPRRARVLALLPEIQAARNAPPGESNWFSGYAPASGVFYCPVSLVPSARPTGIKASRKQVAAFEWEGGQLKTVRTSSTEKGEASEILYFDYFPGGRGVQRVATEPLGAREAGTVRFTPEGTIGPGKGTYVTLFNHPTVDPYMVQKFLDRRVGTIVAGNPFLVPFVWEGIFVFSAEYDASGHVTALQQLGAGEKRSFRVSWKGDRVTSITETGVQGGYVREMNYTADRITDEVIRYRGAKPVKITYQYKAEQLVEADMEADPSLDGRSRKVFFRN